VSSCSWPRGVWWNVREGGWDRMLTGCGGEEEAPPPPPPPKAEVIRQPYTVESYTSIHIYIVETLYFGVKAQCCLFRGKQL